jgi:SAM-dependent methyltransferase
MSLSFNDNLFDYVIVLGVLHHIPNVSYVVSELVRVLKPGGILMVREPISNMRRKNILSKGLSPNERGIPKEFFVKLACDINLKILNINYAYFPPLMIIISKIPVLENVPRFLYLIDRVFCNFTGKYSKYDRKSMLERCIAGNLYYVFQK